MAETEAGETVVTFVNVFTCEPEHQQALVETLSEETASVVARIPGFLSASIHASLDGRRVCNYARWSRLDEFQRMMAGRAGHQLIENVRRSATAVDVHLYRVVRSFSAGGGGPAAEEG